MKVTRLGKRHGSDIKDEDDIKDESDIKDCS